MKNNWARSTVGTLAIVEVEKTCSPSHTIIRAIHSSSIIHVAIKEPSPRREKAQKAKKNKSEKSKRKLARGKDQRVSEITIGEPVIEYVKVESSDDRRDANKPPSKGATTAYFIKFMDEMLDIMDMDDLS
ncbi:hypothetical protein PS15m_001991 [Mucor circinelloides]